MLSRRGFLAVVGTGLVVTGVAVSLPSMRRYLEQNLSVQHVPGPASDGPLDPELSAVLVSFIGVMFGQELASQDRHELNELVAFAAAADSGWVPEYRWLVSYIDDLAKTDGAGGFSSATAELQASIMQQAVSRPASGLTSELLAVASEQALFQRRMALTTVPHLRRVYLASGAPWRRRGYTSWPGVPGDPREYTRPGPVPRC